MVLALKEDFLQFVWQHKILAPKALRTASGKELKIIHPGELNRDAGPDFFNAKIQLEDLILVGNIEVHLHSSDWLKHGHQNDKRYNTIILHVVFEHDVPLQQNHDFNVEVLELKNLISEKTLLYYEDLVFSKQDIACASQLKSVYDLKFSLWLERMTVERLENKVQRLQLLFNHYQNDYVQTFYLSLLRNFGFKVNADAFELLAKQLPVHLLLNHANELFQLEALLLGMAGLLDGPYKDKYILSLQNEFEFLRQKYKLIPLQKELFKFSRLRPANFPGIRLAQFAKVLHEHPKLFSSPHTVTSYDELLELFSVGLEGYWSKHYNLDGNLTSRALGMGSQSIENILINTIAPFFFFYGKLQAKPNYQTQALTLLEACAFENNRSTRFFLAKKMLLQSAANSQGLLNLYSNYCCKKRCLSCGIGMAVLNPS